MSNVLFLTNRDVALIFKVHADGHRELKLEHHGPITPSKREILALVAVLGKAAMSDKAVAVLSQIVNADLKAETQSSIVGADGIPLQKSGP